MVCAGGISLSSSWEAELAESSSLERMVGELRNGARPIHQLQTARPGVVVSSEGEDEGKKLRKRLVRL